MGLIIIIYLFTLSILAVYSYGFVDSNLILSTSSLYQKFHQPLFELVFNNRPLSTAIFVLIIFLSSISYLLFSWFAIKKKFKLRQVRWLIGLSIGILLFSFPAFSYDIFNYILTAKVTFFYKENPYLVMPIELVGDPNLMFTRATNKIALYGPSWIGLTALPYLLGFNNIIATILSFKLFIAAFYIATVWLIWKFSRSIYSVTLFALNPVVLIETLVNAHNDMVMMFFALSAFYLIKQKKKLFAVVMLTASILIKYATLFLIPVFIYSTCKILSKRKLDWDKVHPAAALSMFAVFLLSPLREEIYSWYVVWVLTFVALVPRRTFLLSLTLTLSVGTLLRYVPVLYTGSYVGMTPIIKEVMTFIPVFLITMVFIARRFI